MPLKSRLLRGNGQLEAAAASDPAHITEGARGEHVRKIQLALIQLDGAAIDPDGIYGPATTAAVLAYKRKRNIINRSYQTTADGVVGRMTMTSLDEELAGNSPAGDGTNAQIAAAVLATLGRMDQVLGGNSTLLNPVFLLKMQLVRVAAFQAAGTTRLLVGEVKSEFDRGMVRLNTAGPRRAPVVFAAAPAVAAGGAIVAIEIAIVAAGVILLLCVVSDDFRNEVSTLANKTLDAMGDAIVQAFASATALTEQVNRCNNRIPNPTPPCKQRRDEFKVKKTEFDAKQRDASRAVSDALQRFGKVVPLSKIDEFKAALKKARAALDELKELLRALEKLKELLFRDCGCRFLGL